MADDVSRWVRSELSCSANFGPISTKLERSVEFVIAVVVAESADVEASCGRSIVRFCDKSGRVVGLVASIDPMSAMMDKDGSRPAVVNRNLVMLFTPLPSRRRGSAIGAHNLSVLSRYDPRP